MGRRVGAEDLALLGDARPLLKRGTKDLDLVLLEVREAIGGAQMGVATTREPL